MTRHNCYIVHMEKQPDGEPYVAENYNPDTWIEHDHCVTEGLSVSEAYAEALAANPGFTIIGHHITEWED